MKYYLPRFIISLFLLTFFVLTLSSVKEFALIKNKTSVQVNEWEVIDHRSLNKLFKIANYQDYITLPSLFNQQQKQDTLLHLPISSQVKSRVTY